MSTNWKDLARATLEGSESGAMTFPQNLRLLMDAGFAGYVVSGVCSITVAPARSIPSTSLGHSREALEFHGG